MEARMGLASRRLRHRRDGHQARAVLCCQHRAMTAIKMARVCGIPLYFSLPLSELVNDAHKVIRRLMHASCIRMQPAVR